MSFFQNWFGGGGSDAASRAQQAYAEQMQKAIEEYEKSRAQGRTDISQYFERGLGFEQPYLQAGQQGLQSYLGTLGLGDRQGAINRFQASPGYQFALQQGTQAAQRAAAARGMTGSGAEQRALTQYGQGLAGQEYGKYQSQLAGLASMGAGMGQTAAQQAIGTGQHLAGLGEQYAQLIGGAYGGMGKSAAESIMAGYGADERQRAGWLDMLGKLGGSFLGQYGMPGFGGGGIFQGGGGGRGGAPWLNPDYNRFM